MKKIMILAFSVLSILSASKASAQTIDFEDASAYRAVGVYDSWEQSPFRTGVLQGNAQIIANHLADDTNASATILGFQRSRLAGNTYGVRIDLNEPMTLGPTAKYVHVLINRPNTGRCMLICLGKRTERTAQLPTVEQTWTFSSGTLLPDTWCDAVFQIKSASGVEIHSLVICPDVESPHALQSDFAVYLDDIVINDQQSPRIQVGNYPVNAGKDAKLTRSDRYTNTVNVKVGETSHAIAAGQQSSKALYVDKTADTPIPAKSGDAITVTFSGKQNWMNGFVYLDRDNNGRFETEGVVDGVIPEGSDVMSFSFVGGDSGFNSNGQAISGSSRNTLNPPAFTLPELACGIYRMRCKVDWADLDPAGSIAEGNTIVANGGILVDVLVNVHADTVTVSDNQLNGEVLAADGSKLNQYQAAFGQPFTIKMNPERGFTYQGIRVRHGYLGGDSLVSDNAQYRDVVYSYALFDEDNTFTIPAEVMDGDIQIEGLFVEDGHREEDPTEAVSLLPAQDILDMDNGTTKTVVIGDPHKKNGYFFGFDGSSKVGRIAFGTTADNYTMSEGLVQAAAAAEDEAYRLLLHKTDEGKYTIESKTYPGVFLTNTPDWGDTAHGWTALSVSSLASTSDMAADYDLAQLVRFSATGTKQYLNSQGNISNWKLADGEGEWSIWCVYEVNTGRETAVEDLESSLPQLPNSRNPEIHDLQGRRVTAHTSGVYIVNGKKVLVR